MKNLLFSFVFMVFFTSCIHDECIDCSALEEGSSDFDQYDEDDSESFQENGGEESEDDTDVSEPSESDVEHDDKDDNGNGEKNDDDDGSPVCGNGIVEDGEICDGNKIPCYELDPSYMGGEAICKDDCLGWDTEYCFEPPEIEPIASIPPRSFTVEYLYNGADAFSYGANQNNELWDGPLFSTSIPLTEGTYYIPHNLSDVHWLAGFYDAQTVQFVQQSFVLSSGAFTLPYVVMGVLRSAAVKDAVLSIGITDENEVNFVVFDMMSTVDCVILVGYGTLSVNSINIAQGHAGLFQFSTSEIDLFLPVETPEGDMIPEIQAAGFTVCQ